MRLSARLCGVMAAFVAFVAVAPANAAARKDVFPEAARQVEGGRSLQVIVAQQELKSDINTSNLAAAAGGGLMMALIDAAVEAERAKKAEAAIGPLRTQLQGYDADTLAVETTKAVVEQTPWLQPSTSTFGRDSSVVGKSAALDASAEGQVVFFEYAYDVSPDFSSLRVALTMQVANKALAAGKKPVSRLQPKQLVYTQTITSIVSLPSPSSNASENVARWTADDAKLARKALGAGFDQIRVLAPRALAFTEADMKAMWSRDKKSLILGGFGGRLQEETPAGSLLFTGAALVHVQTIVE